ncbi:MAG: hypothetical protein K940chlam6_00761, partial [Chlamydiae bacterium]|nr:hypothetical protein [Chlamydiota bacterium]
ENSRSPLAIALEQKLVFLAQSIRPDVKREEKVFRIGVKGSDAQQIVREGEPIHCNLTTHVSGGVDAVEFLEGDGNAAMIPHVLDARSLLLKVKQGADEAMEVILKASVEEKKAVSGSSQMRALQEAKWWGPDLFFREYGGEEYSPLSQKQQVEVACGKERYVLYLGCKDFLSFRDGKWAVIAGLKEAERDAPLAHVQSLTQGELEIEAWDTEGFLIFHAKLAQERPAVLHFSPEQVIQGAKQRTSEQVSCKIGKKRFVLKAGDWLIKTKDGWHKLKTANDIDAYLNHGLRGDLCVIDRIDRNGKVQGRYFNEMRTGVQHFALRAISSKGNRKK